MSWREVKRRETLHDAVERLRACLFVLRWEFKVSVFNFISQFRGESDER